MDAMGIKKIARDVIRIAERLQLNKESIEKMNKFSKENVLPRLIFEAGTVFDIRREFFIATYAAEGKDPLVFPVYIIFDKLENLSMTS